jgi:hypothetical protein
MQRTESRTGYSRAGGHGGAGPAKPAAQPGASPGANPGAGAVLPGLPRGPMSPQQQAEALRRVQSQAEQRVKLGMQLFKAAEAHVGQQRDLVQQIKADQQRLHGEIQADVARTLQQYDQWVGRIDENFTKAIRGLEERMQRIESEHGEARGRLESMVRRAEALLDQARAMLESGQSVASTASAPADVMPPRPVRVPPRATSEPRAQTQAPAEAPTPPPATPAAAPAPAPASDPAASKIYSHLLRRLREPGDGQSAAA